VPVLVCSGWALHNKERATTLFRFVFRCNNAVGDAHTKIGNNQFFLSPITVNHKTRNFFGAIKPAKTIKNIMTICDSSTATNNGDVSANLPPVDLLDEREIAYCSNNPPTALEIYNDDSSLSFQREGKLVVVPSSNVLIDKRNESAPTATTITTYYPGTVVTTNNGSTNAESNSFYYESQQGFPVTMTPSDERYFRGRRVKDENAHLPDRVLQFKENRKARTVASAWAGGAIGLVTLGPLGAVVGATGGYAISKSVGKARERRLTRRCEEQQVVGDVLPPAFRTTNNTAAAVPRAGEMA
jgi:hypothetical protein